MPRDACRAAAGARASPAAARFLRAGPRPRRAAGIAGAERYRGASRMRRGRHRTPRRSPSRSPATSVSSVSRSIRLETRGAPDCDVVTSNARRRVGRSPTRPEGDFMELLRHAGIFALLSLAIDLVPLVMAAGRPPVRPTERNLALMRPLSLAGLFAALAGGVLGFLHVLRGIGIDTGVIGRVVRPYRAGRVGVPGADVRRLRVPLGRVAAGRSGDDQRPDSKDERRSPSSDFFGRLLSTLGLGGPRSSRGGATAPPRSARTPCGTSPGRRWPR